MPSQAEVLNNSADKYDKKIDAVKKDFEAKLIALIQELDTKDGKILNSNDNIDRVLIFKKRISELLNESGYADLVGEFIGEVPELISKI